MYIPFHTYHHVPPFIHTLIHTLTYIIFLLYHSGIIRRVGFVILYSLCGGILRIIGIFRLHCLSCQYLLGYYRRHVVVIVYSLYRSHHQSQRLFSMLRHPSYPCSNNLHDRPHVGTFGCTDPRADISHRRTNTSSRHYLCLTNRHRYHSYRCKYRQLSKRIHCGGD